jgi:hypothetical protein
MPYYSVSFWPGLHHQPASHPNPSNPQTNLPNKTEAPSIANPKTPQMNHDLSLALKLGQSQKASLDLSQKGSHSANQ